jgi:hypothetical protein
MQSSLLKDLKTGRSYTVSCTPEQLFFYIRSKMTEFIYLYSDQMNHKLDITSGYAKGKDMVRINSPLNYSIKANIQIFEVDIDKDDLDIVDKSKEALQTTNSYIKQQEMFDNLKAKGKSYKDILKEMSINPKKYGELSKNDKI